MRTTISIPLVLLYGILCASIAGSLAGCGGGPKPANKVAPATEGGDSSQVSVRIRPSYALDTAAEEPTRPKVVVKDRREWDLPETAANSLGRIGAAAVPDLTKQLVDDDPLVRKRAADVLARIGPDAQRAVPDLVAALEDADPHVRKSAALALGQIGPAAADAVPALMKLMNETVAKAPSETQR